MWTRVKGVCIDTHLTETWCKVSLQDVRGQGGGRGWLTQKDGREASSTGTLQEQDGAQRGQGCWQLLGRLRIRRVAHDTGSVLSHLSPTENVAVCFLAGMCHTEVLSLLKVL